MSQVDHQNLQQLEFEFFFLFFYVQIHETSLLTSIVLYPHLRAWGEMIRSWSSWLYLKSRVEPTLPSQIHRYPPPTRTCWCGDWTSSTFYITTHSHHMIINYIYKYRKQKKTYLTIIIKHPPFTSCLTQHTLMIFKINRNLWWPSTYLSLPLFFFFLCIYKGISSNNLLNQSINHKQKLGIVILKVGNHWWWWWVFFFPFYR